MRNVRIEATGEESLSIDVTLGGNVRKTWPVEAGDSIDLTVGGNQKLLISAVAAVVEAEVPTATLEEGADISPDLPVEAEDFDVNTDDADEKTTEADEEVVGGVIDDRAETAESEEGEAGDDHGFFDIPESDDEKGDPEKEEEGETVIIGPEDVSSIDIFDLPADAAIQIEQPFPDQPTTEA
ncbi:MAG TPA: hypothetical protein ENH62_04475 [Marinobacter sp.]|uniref:Uncharacterized protein n=1 Tax=marine sediment metagenome TaxID=412755 RepID=A0A0F9PA31_9ZZZZ|nr:hypothetical protein [Marinobacter sp.]